MQRLPNAEDLAYGCWPDILAGAGVDRSFLTGRHGPCPFCGGTDRYRFQAKSGGRYLCNSCTNGEWRGGFDFLMRHMGYQSFRQAADHVREHFNITPGSAVSVVPRPQRLPQARQQDQENVSRARVRMEGVWNASRPVTPGDAVDRYLRSRVPGLPEVPRDIRFHPALAYWEAPETLSGKPRLLGTYPAMVVRGFDAQGELVQVHKTYLTEDGWKADVPHPKKTDVGVGCNSFALRLGQPTGDSLGVCEGIETALASMVIRPGLPVWPCHSSSILANFAVPEDLRHQVKRVIIFSDSDEMKNGRRAGQEAAALLASRLRQQGIRSLIIRPARVGTDMVHVIGGN